MPFSDKRESWCLIVQDNTEEGGVDLDSAVVFDEAQFFEFVDETIYPRPHGPKPKPLLLSFLRRAR